MEQRVATALARIEAAAARIEAAARASAVRAAQASAQPSHSAPAFSGDDPLLAMKHAQLRADVGATLRELDTLIGSLEHG